jgi:hypothetical protein
MFAIGELIDAGDEELSFFVKRQATQKNTADEGAFK